MEPTRSYRQDIDGLRGLAVAIVVLFHFGVGSFTGGYIGVDVFFVISGFLITKILLDDLAEDGKISWIRFFAARARRLLPALVITVLGTAIGAATILPPHELQAFTESAWASIAGGSNILFWQQSGYFDADAHRKPLLHTWSLGVEWQFYLLWPLLMLVAYRLGRAFWPLIAVIGAASLAAAELTPSREAAYFLPQYRAYEFIIGALLVKAPHIEHKILGAVTSFVGLALILVAAFTFDEQTAFPGVAALLPTAGAALVMLSGNSAVSKAILTNKVAVWLGRASYSIYLTHWPIFVLTLLAARTRPDVVLSIVLIFATLAVSFLTYRYIETPFRKSQTWTSMARPAVPAFTVASVALASLLLVSSRDGLAFRVDQTVLSAIGDPATFRERNFGGYGEGVFNLGVHSASPSIIFVGDSQMDQFAAALDHQLGDIGLSAMLVADHGCLMLPDAYRYLRGRVDQRCVSHVDQWLTIASETNAPVVLANMWYAYSDRIGTREDALTFDSPDQYRNYVLSRLKEAVDTLGSQQVILLGSIPRADTGGGPVECLLRPSYLFGGCSASTSDLMREMNAALADFAHQRENVTYLALEKALCEDDQCLLLVDGNMIFSNAGHLSTFGANMVARLMLPMILATIAPTSLVAGAD